MPQTTSEQKRNRAKILLQSRQEKKLEILHSYEDIFEFTKPSLFCKENTSCIFRNEKGNVCKVLELARQKIKKRDFILGKKCTQMIQSCFLKNKRVTRELIKQHNDPNNHSYSFLDASASNFLVTVYRTDESLQLHTRH